MNIVGRMRKKLGIRRNNRRGIEMSINFLVILILGVAMLSLGIWLLAKFFSSVSSFDAAVSERERKQMLQLIGTGDVILQPESFAMLPNKQDALLIAIHSRIPGTKEFEPTITFKYAVNRNDEPICDELDQGNCFYPDEWINPRPIPLLIRNTETAVFKAPIKIPRQIKPGLYTFEVCVENPELGTDTQTGTDTNNCGTSGQLIYGKRAYFTIRVS